MSSTRRLSHDWYPANIPGNVEIGEHSWLYSSYAFLHCASKREQAVRIGKSSGLYDGCFFDLGPSGHVEIGDFSTLVGVIFATNERVQIGNYCFLAHEVVIADDHAAIPFKANRAVAEAVQSSGDGITLGDDVWVGAGAVLLRGARIGNGAVLGAGAVVNFEVPPLAVVAGNPARLVGTVS